MKLNYNRKFAAVVFSAALGMNALTGFTSFAAEKDRDGNAEGEKILAQATFEIPESVKEVPGLGMREAEEAAKEAKRAYIEKIEEERRAQEEAERAAQEQATAEQAALAVQADKELLAALIFCEAGNQPYEGQVAVGAVVMNRVRSGVYPDSISEVIYQSGQFTPAMTGWLDSVLAGQGYTDSAMQAAEDALAGSNPVGECMYFNTGGYGLQIGDHFFH